MNLPTKEELDRLDRLGRSPPTIEAVDELRRVASGCLPGLVALARQALELRERLDKIKAIIGPQLEIMASDDAPPSWQLSLTKATSRALLEAMKEDV